jgi:hypothetical protein
LPGPVLLSANGVTQDLTKNFREDNNSGSRKTPVPLPNTNKSKVQHLRDLFEGREAIYIEKGALRVKVSNIREDIPGRYISADVKEIPTAGFPTGSYHDTPSPRHWRIGSGWVTTFSDHTWQMGYGGWSLFFAPRIVDGVVRLARQFPDNLPSMDRYNQILRYLQDHEAHEPTQRVFGES